MSHSLENLPDDPRTFAEYLRFISDMLGGDLFPIDWDCRDLRSLVSHRAIDYELISRLVREIQACNTVFSINEKLDPWDTLDALGKVRGDLLRRKGDIHQISLIDRIGELTVSFFNLSHASPDTEQIPGKVHSLLRRK